MEEPAREEPARSSLLRNRAWVTYWLGAVVSSTGTWVQNVAASVLMYELTGSSLMVGLLQAMNFGPLFLLSMVGGILSDRYDRRWILVGTHAAACLTAVALALLTLTDLITPIALLIAAAIIGSMHALSKPTMLALVPALVQRHEISRASAANVMQFNLGQVLGSSLATVLLLTIGAGFAFLINAGTFLGPVLAVLIIGQQLRASERAKVKGLKAAIDGIRYVRNEGRMASILLAIVCVNGVSEGLRTLAPGIAVERLGEGAEVAGLLIGAASLGAAASLLGFGLLQRLASSRRLLAIGFASQIVGAVGMGTTSSLVVALASGLAAGFGFALLIPLLTAGLQELSADEYRGRVMATFSMAHLGVRPFWSLNAGWVAVLLNPGIALIALATGAVVGLATIRRIRPSTAIDGRMIAIEPAHPDLKPD